MDMTSLIPWIGVLVVIGAALAYMLATSPAAAEGPHPPTVTLTVVTTLLLNVVGIIPALVATRRAAALQAPTAKYWQAFGVALAISAVTSSVLILTTIGVIEAFQA